MSTMSVSLDQLQRNHQSQRCTLSDTRATKEAMEALLQLQFRNTVHHQHPLQVDTNNFVDLVVPISSSCVLLLFFTGRKRSQIRLLTFSQLLGIVLYLQTQKAVDHFYFRCDCTKESHIFRAESGIQIAFYFSTVLP